MLNDIEEFLPSETESIGEEPPRPIQPNRFDQQDNVSRNSLEEEVCYLPLIKLSHPILVFVSELQSELQTLN